MGIKPPSDIVLDVARAADPMRYQAAVSRLTGGPGAVDAAGFDAAFESERARLSSHLPQDLHAVRTVMRNQLDASGPSKAQQQLEALILQSFIEDMLPKAQGTFYGKGVAAGIWKSLASEQIAAQIVKAGGVGITSHVFGRAVSALPSSVNPAASTLEATLR